MKYVEGCLNDAQYAYQDALIGENVPMHSSWEKNRKTFFDFLSSGLGINVSLFRLRQFGKVESELGSPVAGVEIGIG